MKYLIDENERINFPADEKTLQTINSIMDILQGTDLSLKDTQNLLYFCSKIIEDTVYVKDIKLPRMGTRSST